MSDETSLKAILDLQKLQDPSRQFVEMAKAVETARQPWVEALRHMEESSGMHRLLETINHSEMAIRSTLGPIDKLREQHDGILRMSIGPLEEFRRAGRFEPSSLFPPELEQARRTMADFAARFRLPELSDTTRLMMEFRASPAAEAMKRYEATHGLKQALESMRTPWLDIQEAMRSMRGFAALHGIGSALDTMPSFGQKLGVALRMDLGDWRDTISWPDEIFTDLRARSDYYIERGFNTALTDFPAPAFEETLNIAGLRHKPPPLIALYGSPTPASSDNEEEDRLARTNMAHDWLQRLETQVRRFIDELMTKAFGPDWPKHRLPNGLYDQWQEKKRKGQQHSRRERTLIAYADFTDYVPVICKRDNWVVFAPFFGRQEDVREAFQRLHPIRLDTMHARPITHDDELLLYVETRRLVRVMIGKESGSTS